METEKDKNPSNMIRSHNSTLVQPSLGGNPLITNNLISNNSQNSTSNTFYQQPLDAIRSMKIQDEDNKYLSNHYPRTNNSTTDVIRTSQNNWLPNEITNMSQTREENIKNSNANINIFQEVVVNQIHKGAEKKYLEEKKMLLEQLFRLAEAFASKGDFKNAVNMYEKILQINEKSASAWIAKGHCLAMIDENLKALESYQNALVLAPETQNDNQFWYGIGLLQQKIGYFESAEQSFKNALGLAPNSNLKGEILRNLGLLLKRRGEYMQAIRLFTQSIISGSFYIQKIVDILCDVGECFEKINDFNEAMTTYRYVVMLDEKNVVAIQALSWLLFQQDKPEEALNLLAKLSPLKDEKPSMIYIQARCFLKLNEYKKAYDCLQRAINLDPSNSTYWSSLGILFAELLQLKQAQECFSNALRYNTEAPENYYNMGCLLEIVNEPDDASILYNKTLEIDSNFQLAKNRLLKVNSNKNQPSINLEIQFKHLKYNPNYDVKPQKSTTRIPRADVEPQITSAGTALKGYLNLQMESHGMKWLNEGVAASQIHHLFNTDVFKLNYPISNMVTTPNHNMYNQLQAQSHFLQPSPALNDTSNLDMSKQSPHIALVKLNQNKSDHGKEGSLKESTTLNSSINKVPSTDLNNSGKGFRLAKNARIGGDDNKIVSVTAPGFRLLSKLGNKHSHSLENEEPDLKKKFKIEEIKNDGQVLEDIKAPAVTLGTSSHNK